GVTTEKSEKGPHHPAGPPGPSPGPGGRGPRPGPAQPDAQPLAGEVAAEARVYRAHREKAKSKSFFRLVSAWVDADPTGRPKDFFAEFRKHVQGEPSWFD